jgi:hypothetical protein
MVQRALNARGNAILRGDKRPNDACGVTLEAFLNADNLSAQLRG